MLCQIDHVAVPYRSAAALISAGGGCNRLGVVIMEDGASEMMMVVKQPGKMCVRVCVRYDSVQPPLLVLSRMKQTLGKSQKM